MINCGRIIQYNYNQICTKGFILCACKHPSSETNSFSMFLFRYGSKSYYDFQDSRNIFLFNATKCMESVHILLSKLLLI